MADEYRLSLGEGNTPLIRSRHIGPALGLGNLYFKLENINPTGSYKDRFAAAALADLLSRGAHTCFATSSGNTGAALAAYSAAAGLRCFLLIVDGAPVGKMTQMRGYGADTLMVKGFGTDPEVSLDVMVQLRQLATQQRSDVQISAYSESPMGMSGVQTIAYELAESHCLRHVFVPAGGGGLALSIVEGFRVWKSQNADFSPPAIHCVQPSGNNTIAGALKSGATAATKIAESTTRISGLQVPNILDGDAVINGCRLSGGTGHLVADDVVYASQHELAVKEGVYCEPAGAVALAGLKSAIATGTIVRGSKETIVCLVTGHGFKDPASATRLADSGGFSYFESTTETFSYIKGKLDDVRNNHDKN